MSNNLKKKAFFLVGLVVTILCLASFASGPEKSRQGRMVKAGRSSLLVPEYLPAEEMRGTEARGAVIIGEMDERAICYDQFLGIFWSDRAIPDADLVPTPAYKRIPETGGQSCAIAGKPTGAAPSHILLRAVKPCGKIVKADLAIIRAYCPKTGTHYAVAGLLDPLLTREKLESIANSLDCN